MLVGDFTAFINLEQPRLFKPSTALPVSNLQFCSPWDGQLCFVFLLKSRLSKKNHLWMQEKYKKISWTILPIHELIIITKPRY